MATGMNALQFVYLVVLNRLTTSHRTSWKFALWWWHSQETCARNLHKFLASNFRASSCEFDWRHIK